MGTASDGLGSAGEMRVVEDKRSPSEEASATAHLDNDADRDGDDLQVRRLEAPDDQGLGAHIWSHDGEPGFSTIGPGSSYVLFEPERQLATGTYPVTYYACDRQFLTPATLKVEVRKISACAITDQQPCGSRIC